MSTPPSKEVYKQELEEIFQYPNMILTGDLNAHHPMWKSERPNDRGNILDNLMDTYDCVLLNTGQPTYQSNNGARRTLDITIVSKYLALDANWFTINNSLTDAPYQRRVVAISRPTDPGRRRMQCWRVAQSPPPVAAAVRLGRPRGRF